MISFCSFFHARYRRIRYIFIKFSKWNNEIIYLWMTNSLFTISKTYILQATSSLQYFADRLTIFWQYAATPGRIIFLNEATFYLSGHAIEHSARKNLKVLITKPLGLHLWSFGWCCDQMDWSDHFYYIPMCMVGFI